MIITYHNCSYYTHRWLATMNYLAHHWRIGKLEDWPSWPSWWEGLGPFPRGVASIDGWRRSVGHCPALAAVALTFQRAAQKPKGAFWVRQLKQFPEILRLGFFQKSGGYGEPQRFSWIRTCFSRWHHLLLQTHFGTQKGNRATICCIASGETVRPQPKTGRPQFRTPGCVLFERVAYGDRRPQAKGPSDSSDSGFIWDSGMFGSLRACNMLHASLNSSHSSLLAGRPDIFSLLKFRLGIG